MCLVLLLHVAAAEPKLLITEIMANPSGSDAAHEWIEVFNYGSTTVDLSTVYFRENDVNHTINEYLLKPDAFVIIAHDATAVSARYSSVTGLVVDSSFSLSNGGEDVYLLKGKEFPGDVIDHVAYPGGEEAPGALSGRSLHLIRRRAPKTASENDAVSRWRNASTNDGISTMSGPDVANPGTAHWKRLPYVPTGTLIKIL